MGSKVKKNKIHSTSNYKLFKPLQGNRGLNALNVRKIISSMKQRIISNPIIVNEKYEIIDGQHRFEALKQLKQPIEYVVQEGLGIAECQLMNCNAKTWSNTDFLNGYCQLGIEDYEILRDFVNDYPYISLHVAEIMLSGGHNIGSKLHESFKRGTFKVTDYRRAIEQAEWMEGFKEYPPFGQKNFMLALLAVFNNPNYNNATMLNKLSFQNSKLQKEVNIETYKKSLSDIYNYKSRDKVAFI